jgi:Arylsulfotransferase (ASST)
MSNSSGTYLINNCGKIINKWFVTQPENHCKLLPNGNLLYMKYNVIHEVNWSGTSVVNLVADATDFYLDYEVIKLANGNYLCVGRKSFTSSEFNAYGYDIPNTYPSVYDIVVEVDKNTGKIVWRWDLIDHVIQDKFPSKKSYGVIAEHPEKININAIQTYDWTSQESFMINGMDYNPDLDQIVLSVRKIGEIVIIDHSTTTQEAKTSSGGKYKRGGDLLYRYGNPSNYGKGKKSDQQLYFQHNPNWILYGPHKGKIMMFNNLLSKANFSSVEIINPPIKPDGTYSYDNTKGYLPWTPDVAYNKLITGTDFQSGYTSCGKVLPNGNIAITTGQDHTAFEINQFGVIVWRYIVPNGGYIFRTERYASDHPAFAGKTLIPGGTIESPSSSYDCQIYKPNATEEVDVANWKIIRYNDVLVVQGLQSFEYCIYNLYGQVLQKGMSLDGTIPTKEHNLNKLALIKVSHDKKEKTFKTVL